MSPSIPTPIGEDTISWQKGHELRIRVKAAFFPLTCRKLMHAVSLVMEQATETLGPILPFSSQLPHSVVAPVEDFRRRKGCHHGHQSCFFRVSPQPELAVPAMKRLRWGRLINISSAHGLTASPYKSRLCRSKNTVLSAFTKYCCSGTGRNKTSPATPVCPGYVDDTTC